MNAIEVKIPKEIRQYKESIFFGLSTRQFFCSLAALFIAAGIYLGLGRFIGRETASWLCIVLAASVERESEEYNRLTSWAEVYDSLSFETKKMFISQFIKSVHVFRDYDLEVEFNVSFEEFRDLKANK